MISRGDRVISIFDFVSTATTLTCDHVTSDGGGVRTSTACRSCWAMTSNTQTTVILTLSYSYQGFLQYPVSSVKVHFTWPFRRTTVATLKFSVLLPVNTYRSRVEARAWTTSFTHNVKCSVDFMRLLKAPEFFSQKRREHVILNEVGAEQYEETSCKSRFEFVYFS